jgi:hypothetical protein
MTTSSENTNGESPPDPLPEGKPHHSLTRVEHPTPVDLQVESLQKRLEKVEDKRNEERWYVAAALCLLFDLLQFPHMGAVQSVLVFSLELIVLLVLAQLWGVDNVLWAMKHTAGFIKQIRGIKDDDKGEEE